MTKNIILLSDGTGNAAYSPHKTNVWRLYKALDISPGSDQVVFYDNGVGTSSFMPTRILGLAFGWGLKKNVKQLYSHLCQVYEDGDRIMIFGFSRGAFTARVTAALIGSQGIVRKYSDLHDLEEQVEDAYRSFRHKNFVPSFLAAPFWIYRKLTQSGTQPNEDPEKRYIYRSEGEPLIRFVGVWDTVDAYGAPIDELTRGWDMVVWPLTAKDRDLSPAVGVACQALALDEQREAFEPMLWNEFAATQQQPDKVDGRIDQVWFAGVHANVGGGYPDDSLAHVSLNWMIEKSRANGVKFHQAMIDQYARAADPCGPLYNNRSGMGNVYRYAPRKVDTLCNSSKPGLWNWLKARLGSKKAVMNDVRVDLPKIHHTVFDRMKHGGDGYAPIGLPERYCVVEEGGNIIPQDKKPADPQSIESTDDAKDRRTLQSEVWNKVWLRKLLYFVTLFLTISFVLYPSYMKGNGEQAEKIAKMADPLLGSVGDLVRTIPQYIGKIPGLGFAESWANSYGDYPYVFLGGLAVILALLYFSTQVNSSINRQMRLNWAHITGNGSGEICRISGKGGIAQLLDSYRDLEAGANTIRVSPADRISRGLRILFEFAAVLLFLVVILLIVWKAYFTAVDGFGGVCKDPMGKNAFGTKIIFDPQSECLDTGLNLEKGREYIVSFKAGEDWRDKTILADLNGWAESPSWYVHLATPIRRHLSKDWYQPIARIGNTWFDRYSAAYKETSAIDTGKRELEKSFSFIAKGTGRLYIYLNDAVAPWPFDRWMFYKNNRGTAELTIETLPATGPEQD